MKASHSGHGAARLARRSGGAEVPGSNPGVPTTTQADTARHNTLVALPYTVSSRTLPSATPHSASVTSPLRAPTHPKYCVRPTSFLAFVLGTTFFVGLVPRPLNALLSRCRMNDTSPEASIQRFVADLKRIREARDVSLTDIHEATRVSEDVLDDFESGDLFNRSSFNPVYLRSLAKSYAQHIGITPAQRVMECLELAQNNRYTNELAVDELGEEPLSITWPDEDGPAETDPDPAPLDDSAFDAPGPEKRNTAAESEMAARRWNSTEPSSDDESAGSPSSSQPASQSNKPLIILGVAVVLVLVGLAWGLMQWSAPNEDPPEPAPTEESPPTPPDDTTETEPVSDATESSSSEASSPELGESIYATLYAANGSVNGVRVQRDDDLRRPYWIEEGDAVVLPFTDRITIEEQLDQLQLFVNEYPVPLEPLDSQDRRVLTRSDLESWADTMQAAPAEDLPAPSDTLRIP